MTRIALTDSHNFWSNGPYLSEIQSCYEALPRVKVVMTDGSCFGFLETIDLHMIALPGAPPHLSRQAIRERYNWSTAFVRWETCIPHYIIT